MIFRRLAGRYGWPPRVVWGLTLPEVRMYCEGPEGGGREAGREPGMSVLDAMQKLNAARADRGLPPLTEVRTLA